MKKHPSIPSNAKRSKKYSNYYYTICYIDKVKHIHAIYNKSTGDHSIINEPLSCPDEKVVMLLDTESDHLVNATIGDIIGE